MNNQHITYDFETLGNSFDAPVIQIGAVKFNLQGEILDRFTRNINWKTLQKYNFTIDYSTVLWWLSQTREAQDSIIDQQGAEDVKKAFNQFRQWIGDLKAFEYWSHATFDAVIFANTCKKIGVDAFIPFRQQRDIRTLSFLTGRIEVERKGIAHSALDDAEFQAGYISKMLQKLEQ